MSLSSSERPGAGTYIGTGLVAAFFAVFLFYPLYYVFEKSLAPNGTFSLTFFKLLFSNPVMSRSIVNSLLIGAAVTLLSGALGFIFATLIVKTDLPAKGFWGNMFLVPMILPPFVGAIGVKYIFGRFGMVNTLLISWHVIGARNPIDWLGAPFWGVVILETLHLFPIMYLNVVGSYALMDPSLEEAARDGLSLQSADLAAGKITRDTRIWSPGLAQWSPLSSFSELVPADPPAAVAPQAAQEVTGRPMSLPQRPTPRANAWKPPRRW